MKTQCDKCGVFYWTEEGHTCEPPAVPAGSGQCTWSQKSHDDIDCSCWHTDCGEEYCLIEGDPKENKMAFCCYCGKPLSVSHYLEKDEETGEDHES